MSIARDRVAFSPKPDRWNVRSLVVSAGGSAIAWLAFSLGALFLGHHLLRLTLPELQTLAFVVLVFGGQANVYLVRERRHFWRSRPSAWMLGATFADLVFVTLLAGAGVLMHPLAIWIVVGLLAASIAYMTLLDIAKVVVFRQQRVSG